MPLTSFWSPRSLRSLTLFPKHNMLTIRLSKLTIQLSKRPHYNGVCAQFNKFRLEKRTRGESTKQNRKRLSHLYLGLPTPPAASAAISGPVRPISVRPPGGRHITPVRLLIAYTRKSGRHWRILLGPRLPLGGRSGEANLQLVTCEQ